MASHARLPHCAAVCVLLAAACSGDEATAPAPPDLTPAALVVTSGNHQVGAVATPLTQPVTVRVTNAGGEPLSDVSVAWNTSAGSVNAATTTTNGDGFAAVLWTVGTQAGFERDTLVAAIPTATSLSVEVVATPIPGPPASIEVIAGDAQTGEVGALLADTLGVRVTDAYGNPTANVAVAWSAEGGGNVSALAPTTDTLGTARARWTLGSIAGPEINTAVAQAAGVGVPARFSALASPGPASRLVILSGDAQTGTAGRALPMPLVVQATDAFDNPVPGALIVWSVLAGDGALDVDTTASDGDGSAAAVFTLGPAAGSDSHLAQAHLADRPGTPVTFRESATPAEPSALVRVAGDGQTAPIGEPLTEPLVVALQDTYGNPIAGRTVNWVVTAGGGTLSAFASATDTQGRAAVTWTLGMTAGPDAQHVQAYVNELSGSPVTFSANATAGAATAITAVSGDGQTGLVGQPLAQPLTVRVSDAGGAGVAGIAVQWSVVAGGGQLATSQTTTDGTGRTSVIWTLGPVAGTAQEVRATAAGLVGSPVTFTATSIDTTTTPASIVLVSGDGQTGAVNETLAAPLVVRVTDTGGQPVVGSTVAWSVVNGGGSLSQTSTVTDAQGDASVMWTLGGVAGTQTVQAASPGLAGSPVTFTATGTVPPPQSVTLAIVSGDGQTATVGQAVAQPLTVVARDQDSLPVSGVTVAWSIAAGGGTVSSTTTVTDAQGQATVMWTLGTVAGVQNNRALATIPGSGSPVTFTASATPDAAAVLVPVSGDEQTGTVAQPLGNPLVVRVEDQFGNATGGVTIGWTVTGGGGVLSDTVTVPDAQGLGSATWTLGTVAGTGLHAVRATSPQLPGVAVDFAATAVPGPAANLTIDAGDAQTGVAGTTLPLPYTVRVTDTFGNPVPSATVSWSVSGGGAVSASVTATDGSGTASTLRTLGSTIGTQTTTASVPGLPPVTFTATAAPVPGASITGTVTIVNQFMTPPPQRVMADAVAVSLPRAPRSKSSPARPAGRRPVASIAGRPRYTPDELIVTFAPDAVSAPSIGSIAFRQRTLALTVRETIEDVVRPALDPADAEVVGVSPVILSVRLRVSDPADIDAVAAKLRANPAVTRVERNALVYSDAWTRTPSPTRIPRAPRTAPRARMAPLPPTTPSDPLYPEQSWHLNLIDAPEAWSITTGSPTVLVAVIDDGARFDHPGVSPNLTNDGYDFVSDVAINSCTGGTISNTGDATEYDADPTQPDHLLINTTFWCAAGSASSGNHGLHVAGIIGAVGNDGVGTTGVNWNVRIRPVRVLGIAGVGTAYDAAQGVLYAAGLPADDGNGGVVQAPSAARIINMSLGGPDPSTDLENAIIAATNAGTLVVVSAGNLASNTTSYPSAYPQTLAVSAVGPDAVLASYSSFGPAIDIAGPGGDLLDGDATYGVLSTAWNYITRSPIYDNAIWDGTSMAAPHVAGVAALLLAQDPSLTVDQLRARLTDYAADLGDLGRDDLYGAGLVNARNSLTRSLAPPTQLYARLYNALNGEILAMTPVQPDGSYAFTDLTDGFYHVFAGLDADGDQAIGTPGRRWGAFGGTATPQRVPITGGVSNTASFSIGLPNEIEPNDDVPVANTLPVGGYLFGSIGTIQDVDVVAVEIPTAGQYTFETSGWIGACGFALEEDTILTLYDALGNPIVTNDDIDFAASNVCSRITIDLTPGTYFLSVEGYFAGRYTVRVTR